MFPDFQALLPEVNATKLWRGRGNDSMRAARWAWQELSVKLHYARFDMDKAVVALAGAWQSPAATQMMTAAAAYRVWLDGVADHAWAIAKKAASDADAYEEALRSMVLPQTIADNRRQTAKLVNDNLMGKHAHEIACLEAEYQRYWGINAKAMYDYAAAIVDSPVKPFDKAPQIINEQGLADASRTCGLM
ncbi:PPE family protein [Mycobacterium haemophilum]|uniref:PPE family protein n=1 Tax=Mycobacterium haemophilum TaxID=29311 RepID=UPI00069AC97A|nr:PPE family protein [Mycobacterium haemophilum]